MTKVESTHRAVNGSGGGRNSLFHAIHYDEIEDAPTKLWTVQDMFGAGEVSVLFGEPTAGKSALATYICHQIAAGLELFGHRVMQGVAVHIALERRSATERRVAALRKHYGIDQLPLVILAADEAADLSKAEVVEDLIGALGLCRDHYDQPVRFCVIDTLADTLKGGENALEEMRPAVAGAARIAEHVGCHIALLHHPSKGDPNSPRGHTSLRGRVDTVAKISKDGDLRTLTLVEANDGPEGDKSHFELKTVELGENTTAPVVVEIDRDQAARLRVSSEPKLRAGTVQASVYECIKTAVDLYRESPSEPVPKSPHLPSETETKGFCLDGLVRSTYETQFSTARDSNRDKFRTDYNRALRTLNTKRIIGMWNNWIWVVK